MQWKIFHLVSEVQITKEQDHENNCLCSLKHDKHVQLCQLSIVLFFVDRKYPHNVVFMEMDKKGAPKEYKEQSTWWRTCFEYQCSLWFIAAAHVGRVATQKKTKKDVFYGITMEMIFSNA